MVEKRYYNVDEIATYLGVRPKTIYNWVHEDYIPYFKFKRLVRFEIREIEKWMNKKRRENY